MELSQYRQRRRKIHFVRCSTPLHGRPQMPSFQIFGRDGRNSFCVGAGEDAPLVRLPNQLVRNVRLTYFVPLLLLRVSVVRRGARIYPTFVVQVRLFSGVSLGPNRADSNSFRVVTGRQDSLTKMKRSMGGIFHFARVENAAEGFASALDVPSAPPPLSP